MRSVFVHHTAVIVETAKEAIDELGKNSWDIVFLDHDLGGSEMVASGPGTGYEVAKWLENNSDKQPPEIVIHSFNPEGARKMKAALPSAKVEPFMSTPYWRYSLWEKQV